jgi:transposase-like protein
VSPRRSKRSETGSSGKKAALDREVLEQWRLEAGRLFRQGVWPAEVARRLGVSRQTATVWHHAWQESGIKGPPEGGDDRPPVPADGGRAAPGGERHLISSYLAEGNRAKALWQYRKFSTQLRRELELEPSPALTKLVAGDGVRTTSSPSPFFASRARRPLTANSS